MNEPCYYRPKTRGELVKCLQQKMSCEVVADNENTTRLLIDGWLNPPSYTVRQSINEGWVIFEKNDK